MRLFFLVLTLAAALLALAAPAQTLAPTPPWVPDIGHGQYKNPVL